MHFYMLFEHKCVLAVCTQPLYNDKTFLFDLIKSLQFFKSSRLSVWRHSDRGSSHDSLIDSSVSAQTALVSYLRRGQS